MHDQSSRVKKDPGKIWIFRQIRQSDIWLKPPEYLKVWLHILLTVPYDGPRPGQREYFASQESIEGVTKHQWERIVAWLRSTGSITTQKTRRGIIIQVVNYARFQSLQIPKQIPLTHSRIMDMWKKVTGGEMNPRNLAMFTRLFERNEQDVVFRNWGNYLQSNEPRYLYISRFEETFGTWSSSPTPRKERSFAPQGRSALSGHKGTTDYGAINPD